MQRLKNLLQSNYFLIFSLIILIIYIFCMTKWISHTSCYDKNITKINGTLIKYKQDGDLFSFTIQAKEKVKGTYYFKTKEEKEGFSRNIKLGQKIMVNGTLKEPQNNTIPNTFNYKKYLYNHQIYWQFEANKIEVLNKNPSLLYKIKNTFIKKANRFNKTSPYMHAFILGDSGNIEDDVYTNYKNNGVTHLFAVSGMHISFFVLIINKLLKKAKLSNNSIFIITLAFLLFYMFLIGFTPSVLRASLLYMLLYFNKLGSWNIKNNYLLYYLFFLLVIINPFYIYDIGFIYSFLTSFGLMLFNKKITGNYLTKLLKTSFIAFIFSLPVTLYNYYEFNLLTILNNIIIVPIVSLILFPLTLITYFIPGLEWILSFGFSVLETINKYLSIISISIVLPKISYIFIFLYYLVIYFMYRFKFRFILVIVGLIFLCKIMNYLDSNCYIYYLDVGQGDATLIITENKKDIILIDSGGKIEYQKEDWKIRNSTSTVADNLIQFLKSLGLTKIDLFIGTHGDLDHIGYVKEIAKKIEIKQIMLNHNNYNEEEKNLINKYPNIASNIYDGKKIRLENLNTYCGKDENESSLILYTKIKEESFLFMGDAPKSIEQDIIKKYKLGIDILKVGHHGSNTSSDLNFLKKINAQYGIISSGRNNRYHHPSKETIENLKKANIKYFNTQEKGTICLILKKNSKKFKFYPP